MARSAFLQEATERGFIHQCTDLDALDAALCAGTVTAYIGFDCTADSLHIGNLVGIMILRLFQKHGRGNSASDPGNLPAPGAAPAATGLLISP